MNCFRAMICFKIELKIAQQKLRVFYQPVGSCKLSQAFFLFQAPFFSSDVFDFATSQVGKSVDEQVQCQANDLLDKVPAELIEEHFRAQIAKKDGLRGTNEAGSGVELG